MSKRRRSESSKVVACPAFSSRTKDKGRRRFTPFHGLNRRSCALPFAINQAQTSTDATRKVKRLILLASLGSAFASGKKRARRGTLYDSESMVPSTPS